MVKPTPDAPILRLKEGDGWGKEGGRCRARGEGDGKGDERRRKGTILITFKLVW